MMHVMKKLGTMVSYPIPTLSLWRESDKAEKQLNRRGHHEKTHSRQHDAARKRLRNRKAALMRAEFKKEYREFFQSLGERNDDECEEEEADASDDGGQVLEFLESGGDYTGEDSESEGPRHANFTGFRKTLVLRRTIADKIPSAIFDSNDGLTETALGDLIISALNHLHRIDFFYPGQKPLPGRWECRFCSKSFDGIDRPYLHASYI
ncbi:MAG: hypothetical protein Q9201_006690 [Fulgogasparrea decipioides]